MKKTAPVNYPVETLIAERWSPRAFTSKSVEPWKMASLLEAARWAPSCFNEQPWRFLVGHREETPHMYHTLQALLVSGNDWAKQAPVLILSVAKRHFTHNQNPNRHAMHDVGQAMLSIALQAEALGLITHQMAGFYENKAYEMLGISSVFYEAATMMAIGYQGTANTLPDDLKARELQPRTRKPLQEIVFGNTWQQPYPGCFT